MAAGQLDGQVGVQRFDELHVGHRQAQALGHRQARMQQGAEGQDGDALALPAHLAPAPRQLGQRGIDGCTHA